MVKQGSGTISLADIVTTTLRNRSQQLADNITLHNAALERMMGRSTPLETFNVLMKLAAGEMVEVPWSMIRDDDRVRYLVNKLVREKQLEYSPGKNSAVPRYRIK